MGKVSTKMIAASKKGVHKKHTFKKNKIVAAAATSSKSGKETKIKISKEVVDLMIQEYKAKHDVDVDGNMVSTHSVIDGKYKGFLGVVLSSDGGIFNLDDLKILENNHDLVVVGLLENARGKHCRKVNVQILETSKLKELTHDDMLAFTANVQMKMKIMIWLPLKN